jgi:AcrR family transcriptional regulator
MTPRDTDRLILDAAFELFKERGYSATSTRAIAERAGVNEVTLFRRFESKRGILKALGASLREGASQEGAALQSAADARAGLEAIAKLELTQATKYGGLVMRLLLEARFEPEVAAAMADAPEDNLSAVAAYIAERQAAGELRADLHPSVMAEAFFALTSQVVMAREAASGSTEPPYGLSFAVAADQLFDVLMTGIGPRERSI